MRHFCLLVLISVLLTLSACRPEPLDEALKGRMEPVNANRVITEYCQSCHIHRTFDPTRHVPQAQALYDRAPFTETVQCRACHLVQKDTWGGHKRKTLWPAEVAEGKHKTLSGLKWLRDQF